MTSWKDYIYGVWTTTVFFTIVCWVTSCQVTNTLIDHRNELRGSVWTWCSILAGEGEKCVKALCEAPKRGK